MKYLTLCFVIIILVVLIECIILYVYLEMSKVSGGNEIKTFPYHYLNGLSLEKMRENLEKTKLKIIDRKGCTFGLLLRSYPQEYENSDSISNHFSEVQRMCASMTTHDSPINIWNKNKNLSRDDLYNYEANLFNPTISMALIRKFNIKTILDPTAGWGDRLIAAGICKIDEYVGFDTNDKLNSAYESIIDYFKINAKVNICPFESKADLFEEGGIYHKYFDCVLTSPPFWTVEIYEGEDTSTNKYKTYEEWIDGFYKPFLRQSVLGAKKYIMLYITHDMFKVAEKYLTDCKYLGNMGFYQTTGNGPINEKRIRNTYIWGI